MSIILIAYLVIIGCLIVSLFSGTSNRTPISAFALGIIKSMTDHPDQWEYDAFDGFEDWDHHDAKGACDMSVGRDHAMPFNRWKVAGHALSRRDIRAIVKDGIPHLVRHHDSVRAAARAALRAPFERMGGQS